MHELRIQQHFIDSADLYYQMSESLAKPVEAAIQSVLASVTGGGKVLVAGMGPALPLAQYLVSLLAAGFERERPGLAALALMTDVVSAAGWPVEENLARQVRALGQAGDVLVLLGTQRDVPVLVHAVHAAHDREMAVLAITGGHDDALVRLMHETDVHVGIAHGRAARVREVQQIVLHCLCDGIDAQLLGEQEPA